MLKVIGGILLFAGFVAVAGSANDCDGACMETANTIGEMLTVVFIGFCLMGAGAFILAKSE